MRWRPKTNRIGHALANGDAVVRIARWQIQHIARVQYVFMRRVEICEYFQIDSLNQRQVFLLADTPFSLAMDLEQENIVTVKVRTDTTTVGGKTDHHIVQSRVWDESKLVHQVSHLIVM